MQAELWDILDENGYPTGRTIERGKLLCDGEYHLVVHIWIVDQGGNLLIQKRADHLQILPGFWAMTGGSAIHGEDSLTAAIRETKEELGIDIPSARLKFVTRNKKLKSIYDIWVVKGENKEFLIDQFNEDVSDVKWVSWEELQNMISKKYFYDYGEDYFRTIRLFLNEI